MKPTYNQLLEFAKAQIALDEIPTFNFEVAHQESDEVSCCCGFVSKAEDYDVARNSLKSHLRYHENKLIKKRNDAIDRKNNALAALGLNLKFEN